MGSDWNGIKLRIFFNVARMERSVMRELRSHDLALRYAAYGLHFCNF